MDETQVSTTGSDAWWVARLMRQLGQNAREAAELRLWMDGRPPLPVPDLSLIHISEPTRPY